MSFEVKPHNLKQDLLDGLVTFVAVAQQRGFSAAAVELGVSPSAVSQAVRQLEARVGTRLFTRTTRSVSLTEAGERYLSRVVPAVEDVAAASEELVGSGEQPVGLLRLNVSRAAYLFALLPLLPAFAAAYPGIVSDGIAGHQSTSRCTSSPVATRGSMYYPTRRRVPRKLAVLIELLRKHQGRIVTAERQRPGRRGARAS